MRYLIGCKWSALTSRSSLKRWNFLVIFFIQQHGWSFRDDRLWTCLFKPTVYLNQHTRTSKLYPSFNLTATLGLLTRWTWETRNDVELLERGWKQGHSDYYIYVFSVRKKVGTDPEGFPCRHIAVHFFTQTFLLQQISNHYCVSLYLHLRCLFREWGTLVSF